MTRPTLRDWRETYVWGAREAGREIRDLIPPEAQAGVTVWCVGVSALCLAGLAALIWQPIWSAWQ